MSLPITYRARICWQNLTRAPSARNTKIDYTCNFVMRESGVRATEAAPSNQLILLIFCADSLGISAFRRV